MHKLSQVLLAGAVFLTTAWAGDQYVGSYVSTDLDECSRIVASTREAYGEALEITDCVEVSFGASDHDMAPERQSP